jgi:hypothetical protein
MHRSRQDVIGRGRLWGLAALTVAAVALVGGCGGKHLAEVKGRVTYEGKPLPPKVTVLFQNADAGLYITAKLDEDGYYRVDMAEGYGLPPGTYDVAVLPPPLLVSPEFIEKHREKGPPLLVAFPQVPLKYRDPKTSGLKLVLTPEGATFNIDMQPEP